MEGLDSIVIFYRKSASAVAVPPLAIFQPISGRFRPLELLPGIPSSAEAEGPSWSS